MARSREPSGEPVHHLEVPPEADGERLDRFLADRLGVGRRPVHRALQQGRVTLQGRPARKGERVRAGQRIGWRGALPSADFEPAEDERLAERLPIVHRDRWLLAVDKPAGVPCHPLRPDERGTVLGALRLLDPAAASAGPTLREGGLLHRLDTDTSGLLLLARSREAFEALAPLVRGGRATKEYLAVVAGRPDVPQRLRGPLAAHPSDPARVVVCAPYGAAERWRGRPVAAETEILEARPLGPWTELRLRLRRGWRHQVRVHLAEAGHPIVGDRRYGGPCPDGVAHHLLHAWRMELPHPDGGRPWRLQAPRPARFEQALACGPDPGQEAAP